MISKTCTKCSETKAVSEFPQNGQGKTRPDCKKCHSGRNSQEYYQSRPEAAERRRKRSSLPKSCGSLAVADSIDKVYGKLTVVRFSGYAEGNQGSRSPLVECLCSCGAAVVVRLWDVKSGKTGSCGNHPRFDDRSLPAFRNIYRHCYKNRALKKGMEFDLSEEQFRVLTQSVCHYCGSPPSNNSYRSSNGKRGQFKSGTTHHSQYVYNGLDRINNLAGYTLDNVVPCCGICNHAKHSMTYEQFMAWLSRVAAFRSNK